MFTKKAKRPFIAHQKFYFLDVGVYHTLRSLGPLYASREVEGSALETFFLARGACVKLLLCQAFAPQSGLCYSAGRALIDPTPGCSTRTEAR